MSRTNTPFEIYAGDGSLILQGDGGAWHFLIYQLAANMIYSCKSFPKKAETPRKGPSSVISDYLRWAPHGYVNALHAQAAIVYAYARTLAAGRESLPVACPGESPVRLITDALAAYQKLREDIELEEIGERGGIAAGNRTALLERIRFDYTDQNDALLKRIQPVAA